METPLRHPRNFYLLIATLVGVAGAFPGDRPWVIRVFTSLAAVRIIGGCFPSDFTSWHSPRMAVFWMMCGALVPPSKRRKTLKLQWSQSHRQYRTLFWSHPFSCEYNTSQVPLLSREGWAWCEVWKVCFLCPGWLFEFCSDNWLERKEKQNFYSEHLVTILAWSRNWHC